MTAKEFKKHAKRKWSQLANALRERVQTVRCADFDTVAATIARSMPGASRRVIRELACSRIRVATISFAASIRTEDPVLLECRDMLTVQHLADLERAAADPRHACIVEGRFLAAQELQYLTSVAQGITVSFCCRSRKCLWFGLNYEWPKQKGSEHFRCPCCAQLYQPMASGKDRAPFSFVLSMPDLENGQTVHFPASWPDAEDHKWLISSIELYAMRPETQASLQAYDVKTAKVELHELLEQVKTPSHFEEQPWDPNGCWHMPADFDLSLYKTRGTTLGCKLDRVRAAFAFENPFTQWPLLSAMVGRVVAQTRAGGDVMAMAMAMPR
jgi:hypothetical protein